jgi:hypothetical protein
MATASLALIWPPSRMLAATAWRQFRNGRFKRCIEVETALTVLSFKVWGSPVRISPLRPTNH